jgi:putative solute:sodium symporter small subunit
MALPAIHLDRARSDRSEVDQRESQMAENSDNNAYWAANIRLVTICLVIWALCSYGFAILLRPLISGIAVGGTDLGFWFAQQGSILVFLFLIFFYAWRMNKLDKEHGVDE